MSTMQGMTPQEIKSLRTSLQMTQKELSEKVGVKKNTVACWEIGRMVPSGSATILLRQLQQTVKPIPA